MREPAVTPPARPWTVPLFRAVPAAVAAVVTTFAADHSPSFGFVAVGAWAIVTAIVLANGAVRGHLPRRGFVAQAALLVAGGTAALLLVGQPVAVLLILLSTLLGVTGVLELVNGIVLRRFAEARDWIFVGAITAVAAVGVLLIPADYNQVFTVPEKDFPPLTASVIAVGLFGAYCAIIAVYLVIAGLSSKWSTDATARRSENK